MLRGRYHIRFIIVATLASALFAQLTPVAVFAANGEDARFDEIDRLLNDQEMLQWMLDAGKFSSLERRTFLSKDAFILKNIIFELNLIKKKLAALAEQLEGKDAVGAAKARNAISRIDEVLGEQIGNKTLSDMSAQGEKGAQTELPNVADVLKDEVILLESLKEILVPALSDIPELFQSQLDKDAVKKSFALIFQYLNEKIALILETLKLIEQRGRPATDKTPPLGGGGEPPVPPKAPKAGAAVKNINFALSMSARTVDAAIKIASGEAPARRLKAISSNGVAVTPEIKGGNLYLTVSGGDLDADSVSVDVGTGVIDTIRSFFGGGVEPEVSGNNFSFALDADTLGGKPLAIAFTVKRVTTVAVAGVGAATAVAHEQALLGALWSRVDDSVNRLADLANKIKREVGTQ